MKSNEVDQRKSSSYVMDFLSSKLTSLDEKLSSECERLSESLVKSIS